MDYYEQALTKITTLQETHGISVQAVMLRALTLVSKARQHAIEKKEAEIATLRADENRQFQELELKLRYPQATMMPGVVCRILVDQVHAVVVAADLLEREANDRPLMARAATPDPEPAPEPETSPETSPDSPPTPPPGALAPDDVDPF